MKILSWTGNYVTPRVGMRVKYNLWVPDGTAKEYTIEDIQEPIFLIMEDGAELMAHNCTMLFAPFVRGDSVEALTKDGEWIDITDVANKGAYASEVFYNYLNSPDMKDFRHADENLRPSPDYVKEV